MNQSSEAPAWNKTWSKKDLIAFLESELDQTENELAFRQKYVDKLKCKIVTINYLLGLEKQNQDEDFFTGENWSEEQRKKLNEQT